MWKTFLANSATWIVAIVLAFLSFMWTQSGRISALEANALTYQAQLNRVEAKIDYMLEHQK